MVVVVVERAVVARFCRTRLGESYRFLTSAQRPDGAREAATGHASKRQRGNDQLSITLRRVVCPAEEVANRMPVALELSVRVAAALYLTRYEKDVVEYMERSGWVSGPVPELIASEKTAWEQRGIRVVGQPDTVADYELMLAMFPDQQPGAEYEAGAAATAAAPQSGQGGTVGSAENGQGAG